MKFYKERKYTLTLLFLALLAVSKVEANKTPKYKLPKRNVEFEITKDPYTKVLDNTPITDYYPIEGTDL